MIENNFICKQNPDVSKTTYCHTRQRLEDKTGQERQKKKKRGYIILVKGTLQQEDTEIIRIYALNVSLPNFIK